MRIYICWLPICFELGAYVWWFSVLCFRDYGVKHSIWSYLCITLLLYMFSPKLHIFRTIKATILFIYFLPWIITRHTLNNIPIPDIYTYIANICIHIYLHCLLIMETQFSRIQNYFSFRYLDNSKEVIGRYIDYHSGKRES